MQPIGCRTELAPEVLAGIRGARWQQTPSGALIGKTPAGGLISVEFDGPIIRMAPVKMDDTILQPVTTTPLDDVQRYD